MESYTRLNNSLSVFRTVILDHVVQDKIFMNANANENRNRIKSGHINSVFNSS